MKSMFLPLFAAASLALAQDFGPIDPVALYPGLFEALSDLHDKRGAVEDYLRGDGNMDNFNCFLALEYLIDSLADSNDAQDRNMRYQAIGCLRDYPCEAAFSYLESILKEKDANIRRMAALTLARLSFDEERWLSRLEAIMDQDTFGMSERREVYDTVSAHLQGGFPPLDRQRRLLRFLLHRSSQELFCPDTLDEILCREIPKWRGSSQRAENAARMIREHPDSARLVAFFQTVRTNVIESARTAPFPDHGDDRAPAATNRTAFVSPPPVAGNPSAGSDPWDNLLDNLPERKPGTPSPDSEPPF